MRLATVLQNTGEFIYTNDVERSLKVSRTTASKLLSRWTSQGWLGRVGPGIYTAVTLDLVGSGPVLDHPGMVYQHYLTQHISVVEQLLNIGG